MPCVTDSCMWLGALLLLKSWPKLFQKLLQTWSSFLFVLHHMCPPSLQTLSLIALLLPIYLVKPALPPMIKFCLPSCQFFIRCHPDSIYVFAAVCCNSSLSSSSAAAAACLCPAELRTLPCVPPAVLVVRCPGLFFASEFSRFIPPSSEWCSSTPSPHRSVATLPPRLWPTGSPHITCSRSLLLPL